MRIRRLKKKDAPLMLEWMMDDNVVHDLASDFSRKRIEDCYDFIYYSNAQCTNLSNCNNLHYAIINDDDEYMGTVSLKNIERDAKRAEFAIALRSVAMGKGFGKFGMDEIMKLAFSDSRLMLREIYWCVDEKNSRAIRFYEKNHYKSVKACQYMLKDYKELLGENKCNLIWYLTYRPEEKQNL